LSTDFAAFLPSVAAELVGPVNERLSSKDERRFGTHGSFAVDLKKLVWFDHETKEGGGTLDLIIRQTGCKDRKGAVDWLKEGGFPVEDEPKADGHVNGHSTPPAKAKIVATYDYVDEAGELIFQVCRFEPKTFRQRRKPMPGDEPGKIRDGWVWSVKGIRQVPYRLPDLLEAVSLEKPIFVVEGEKDVENLARLGITATCNAMGAGKWPEGLADHFRGADVIHLSDNDDAGREHTGVVAAALKDLAARQRVLDLPGLPAKGDVSDWIAAGGTADQLWALVEARARPWAEKPVASRFGAVWFDDIGREKDRADWLVKGILGGRDMSVLYGPPKGGKSFLALDLSCTMAFAAIPSLDPPRWFDRRVYPGGVVYVAAEGQRGMLRRVSAWRSYHNVPVGQGVPFVLLTTQIDLRSADGDTTPLIEEIKRHGARMKAPVRLIVIDTLARALAGGSDNKPEDMGAIIKHCGRIQEEANAHVLIVHHMGKDAERGMRGHNSLHAAIDTAIEVGKSDEGGNQWTLRDQKEGEAGSSFAFRLQPVTIGVDDEGDAITSCVVVPSETGIEPAGQTAKKPSPLPDQARIAMKQLHEALFDAGVRPPASGQVPPNVKAVSWKTWREYSYRGGITANDASDDTKQKAFKRAGEVLRARGYIATWDEWVWPTGRT